MIEANGALCHGSCGVHRYGQLSGMVEPLAGLFGAVAVVVSTQ